jgi:hypothetical protein
MNLQEHVKKSHRFSPPMTFKKRAIMQAKKRVKKKGSSKTAFNLFFA